MRINEEAKHGALSLLQHLMKNNLSSVFPTFECHFRVTSKIQQKPLQLGLSYRRLLLSHALGHFVEEGAFPCEHELFPPKHQFPERHGHT